MRTYPDLNDGSLITCCSATDAVQVEDENPDVVEVNNDDDFMLNFIDENKSRESNFRASFMRKLENTKVWVPATKREPQHQTVIIFDWDDTLFPTSYLVKNGLLHEEEKTLELLKELDQTCLKLL